MTLQAQLIVAAALVLFSFTGGWEVATWRMKASQLEMVNKAVADYKASEVQSAVDAAALNTADVKRKENARVLTVKRRTDIAQNPDIGKCKLSVDVLRDFNDVLTGATPQ